MLELHKGQYYSATQCSFSAGEVLVGLATYQKEQGTSSLHFHHHAHLNFVLSGSMQVRRKTMLSDRTATEPISFVHSQEIHQTTPLSPRCRNVNLELEQRFLSKYDLTEQVVAEGIRQNAFRGEQLMMRLYKEILLQDESFTDTVQMLLLDVIPGWRKTSVAVPVWLTQVRDLLNDRWQEIVGLQEIAEAVDRHPVTISRYFLRHFGITLGEYRRQLKIERAVSLIVSTHQPLSQIAYICGFSDQSHFIRAFKEQTSLLPKQMRL